MSFAASAAASAAAAAAGLGSGADDARAREAAASAATRARVAAFSAAERAACEARFAAACAAADAAGAPAPFRGPTSDSELGEHFLDVIALVSANGFALDVRRARFLCGLTFRLGAPRADGILDRAGFLGGTADMLKCSLRLQAPWRDHELMAGQDEDGMTNLMHAACTSDEKRVRELLAAGVSAYCYSDCVRGHFSALHFACGQSDVRIVVALVEADPDSIDKRTECTRLTPLNVACDSGNEEAARALLSLGAQPSALHYAWSGSMVELLCAAGAEVNGVDDSGYRMSPLMEASSRGHEDAVRALLARGARQELQDYKGWTALHHASGKRYSTGGGHAAIVEILCAAPGAATALALPDNDGQTPLALALGRYGNPACAAALRAHGAAM
jgi:ankyrin repeat protein